MILTGKYKSKRFYLSQSCWTDQREQAVEVLSDIAREKVMAWLVSQLGKEKHIDNFITSLKWKKAKGTNIVY